VNMNARILHVAQQLFLIALVAAAVELVVLTQIEAWWIGVVLAAQLDSLPSWLPSEVRAAILLALFNLPTFALAAIAGFLIGRFLSANSVLYGLAFGIGFTLPWYVILSTPRRAVMILVDVGGVFVAILLSIWLARRLRGKRATGDDPLCLTCGYNLRGNVSGTCPECGTPAPNLDRESQSCTRE